MADQEVPAGEILFCGATDFDTIWSGERNTNYADILRPSRIGTLLGQPVEYIASGSSAAHSVICTRDGRCWTFGYNHRGQLGHGDGGWPTQMRVPKPLGFASHIRIGAASCGKTHTWFLSDEGQLFAVGGNDYGQLGTGNKQPCKTPKVVDGSYVRVAVGQDFSVAVTAGKKVVSCGKPEYGQCGNDTDGEYFITASKLDFDCVLKPTQVHSLQDVHIRDVRCGNNHTVAMDTDGRVFTWGFGGYGRLGHGNPDNYMVPTEIKKPFAEPRRGKINGPLLPPDSAVGIGAGASYSMVAVKSGVTYFFGQTKSSGEATMYPKPISDLQGWRVRAMAGGNTSIVVAAEKSVISWGPAPSRGQLGYGKGEKTSSTVPKKMECLDNMIITQVACGHSHTLLVVVKETQDSLNKLAKFKPKAPKDIGVRPEEPKKKRKAPKKKKKAADAEGDGGDDDGDGEAGDDADVKPTKKRKVSKAKKSAAEDAGDSDE